MSFLIYNYYDQERFIKNLSGEETSLHNTAKEGSTPCFRLLGDSVYRLIHRKTWANKTVYTYEKHLETWARLNC